jgi:hypothetical protein
LNSKFNITGGTITGNTNITNMLTVSNPSASSTNSTANVVISENSLCPLRINSKSNTAYFYRIGQTNLVNVDGTNFTNMLNVTSSDTTLLPPSIGYSQYRNATRLRTLTLLDQNGHTSVPNNLSVGGTILNADLVNQFNGKANTVHTHAISDVTNLQTTLDSKAAKVHTHTISDVTNLQTTLDNKAAKVHTHSASDVGNLDAWFETKFQQALLTKVYPIGAYYISHVNTNPATLFGGTWTQITNRFLYCANSAGTTGGSAKISVDNLPAHYHNAGTLSTNDNVHNHKSSWKGFYNVASGSGRQVKSRYQITSDPADPGDTIDNATHYHTIFGYTATTGSGTDYFPPYTTVFCFRRTG